MRRSSFLSSSSLYELGFVPQEAYQLAGGLRGIAFQDLARLPRGRHIEPDRLDRRDEIPGPEPELVERDDGDRPLLGGHDALEGLVAGLVQPLLGADDGRQGKDDFFEAALDL